MTSIISRFALAAATIMVLSGTNIPSLTANAQEVSDRQEIELIIREYLLENPELLLEMQGALEARQQQQLAAKQKKTLKEKHDIIYASDHQIEIGDPNAKITVVEFFDYNCGFCFRALDDMNRLVQSDKSVRFVLKEFPVLGEGSVGAHRVSLAVSRLMPEKYGEFHVQLLGLSGPKDSERAIQLAMSMGADETALRSEMEKPFVVEAFRETYELADDLGINGTPSYVIGDEVVFGAVGYDQLEQKVTEQTQ